MKYFYIICLALSSIFTYKHLVAQEQAKQYAFFMPSDAFLQNTAVDDIEKNPIRRMQPKVSNSKDKIKPKITLPYVRKKVQLAQPENRTRDKKDVNDEKRRKTKPLLEGRPQKREVVYEQPKVKKLEQTHISQQIVDNPNGGLAPDINERLKQYSLDESLAEEEMYKAKEDSSSLEENNNQLSVEDMLKKIPFPDVKLPKYKRAYADYGMDLRVLYRRGELPNNSELEAALAKATTIQRFKVE